MITSLSQRWRDRRSTFVPEREPFDPRAFDVAPIADDTTARRFVVEHHYSQSYPAARRRFGLYERGALAGVAVFSVPARPEVLRPLPGGFAHGLDLGRFVLLDSVRFNGESWFLARCADLLRREGWAGFVAFSDPYARSTVDGREVFSGHVGQIYQATNAVYLGQARANTLLLLPDGRVFSRRALAKIRQGERGWRYAVEQLVSVGAPSPSGDLGAWLDAVLPSVTRKVRHPGNLKYVFGLQRATKRALPSSLPYPRLTIQRRAA